MAKKKAKKKFSKFQVFLLGLITGIAIWIPIDQTEFSDVQLTQVERQSVPSIFSSYLPVTSPVIYRQGYMLAYDGRTRNAHWVYHRVTPSVFETKEMSRKNCDFQEDPLLPTQIRATKSDFKGSGFDRGHLCPAADSSNQREMEETFFLSNISPQTPAFNRGYWKKLESHIRDLTKQYNVVHVFSGPLYLGEKDRDGKQYVCYELIGKNSVAVPTHFFALIFSEDASGKLQAKGYILPNTQISAKTSLKKFSKSVEEIESASGTIFTQLLELHAS